VIKYSLVPFGRLISCAVVLQPTKSRIKNAEAIIFFMDPPHRVSRSFLVCPSSRRTQIELPVISLLASTEVRLQYITAEVSYQNKIHARFPQQMAASGREPLLSGTSLTFDVLPPSLHVLLEAESVVVAQLSEAVFAEPSAEVVFVAVGLSEAVFAELSAEVAFVHFEVDNSEHRSLFVLTNIVWYASLSSSVGDFD